MRSELPEKVLKHVISAPFFLKLKEKTIKMNYKKRMAIDKLFTNREKYFTIFLEGKRKEGKRGEGYSAIAYDIYGKIMKYLRKIHWKIKDRHKNKTLG